MRSLVNYSRGHEVKWAEILEKKSVNLNGQNSITPTTLVS